MPHERPGTGVRRAVGVARPLHAALPLLVVCLSIFHACRPGPPEAGEGSAVGPPGATTVSVTLAWDPPVTDAGGAALDDLAGYRLYFGTATPLDVSRDTFVEVGAVTAYTLEDLPAGTYYFATTAVDESGNESALSDELRAELTP